MAFGVSGQYKMSVTIGTYEDFLKEDKFISFTLIDNVGLSLPYWELVFDCVYPEILALLNEKQTITVQIGTDTNTLVPFELVIKKPIIIPKSADCSEVTLRGFNNMLAYLENENASASAQEETSIELMQRFATKYGLTFSTNLEQTTDKMVYLQPNISDYKFLFSEWLHSNSGTDGDIIIPTITASNKFTYNSLNKLVLDYDAEKTKTFTDVAPEEKEYLVDANQLGSSNTTIANTFGNYFKDRFIFDVSKGVQTLVSIKNNVPIISESSNISVAEGISKVAGFFMQGSNVHLNYYKQELSNRQKWFSIQSSKQWVSVNDIFVQDLEPGMLTMYMTKKSNNQVNDQTSGLYLITKRVLSVKDRAVKTNFQLSRENLNYSK